MSLKSLFTITLSLLLIIILGVVFTINVKNVQQFLENQVYSTSQDTVYSLGMSLATLDKNASSDDIELMVNAIFDSGYYEYIKFYDNNGKIIYENSLPVIVKDVPSWYISILPIDIKEATGIVSRGWEPIGKLAIKGHPGYAYHELYKNFKSLLLTFSIIAIIAFFALISIINTLLYSLNRIKEQANAINKHKFIIEKDSPFISEFSLLINAMNKMVKKVESIFISEVKTFEQLQTVLYKDEETGIPNKKYFMLKLKEILDDETRNIGYLAIISINGLDKLRNEKSYQFYKETLMKFINTIPQELSTNNLVARINDYEIAVLFNTHDLQKIENYFEELQTSLSITSRDIDSKEKLFCFSIGVSPYFEDDQISQALSRLDYSLSRSKINGCNIIDIYDDKEHNNELVTLGKNSWKAMFDKIFNDNRILIATQSIINQTNNTIYHNESLLRIKEDDNSLQTAGYYLPMANALGLVSQFDSTVIDTIITNIDTYKNPIAINISKDFVMQSLLFLELRSTLAKIRTTHQQKLHFECSENEILLELDSYIEFSEMVHAHNQKFGIDRFSGIENVSYIEKLRPDYIKINVNFVLESLENNEAILNTLNILSKTMGITLIITAVQNVEQLARIKAVGYEYFQGRYISDIKV